MGMRDTEGTKKRFRNEKHRKKVLQLMTSVDMDSVQFDFTHGINI